VQLALKPVDAAPTPQHQPPLLPPLAPLPPLPPLAIHRHNPNPRRGACASSAHASSARTSSACT
jgi:hypothetical protein